MVPYHMGGSREQRGHLDPWRHAGRPRRPNGSLEMLGSHKTSDQWILIRWLLATVQGSQNSQVFMRVWAPRGTFWAHSKMSTLPYLWNVMTSELNLSDLQGPICPAYISTVYQHKISYFDHRRSLDTDFQPSLLRAFTVSSCCKNPPKKSQRRRC